MPTLTKSLLPTASPRLGKAKPVGSQIRHCFLTWWDLANCCWVPAVALIAVGRLDKNGTVAKALGKHLAANVVESYSSSQENTRHRFALAQNNHLQNLQEELAEKQKTSARDSSQKAAKLRMMENESRLFWPAGCSRQGARSLLGEQLDQFIKSESRSPAPASTTGRTA